MRFLLLFLIFLTQALAADLTPDPTVVWGTLPNGLRYALMPNAQPKDKVTLRLQVQCGSLQENEAQRGLAHYLEHLAFNGTTNYPPGTLITKLQHLGLAFGAHTNAHTSYEETVYKLELPDAKPETIATGLGVLADWGGGMLLEPAEIDKERGIILAELRDRDGASLRQWRALYAGQYAGTVLADRMPIGHAATIQAADRALIAAYYDAWYRPERMVLAVVGAIDPAAVAAQLAATVGTIQGRGAATPLPDLGTLTPTTRTAVVHTADPEADNTMVMVVRVMPETRPADSREHRRDELARALAEAVLARRLRTLIEKDSACPLQEASSYSYHDNGFAHAGIQGTAKPGQALAALRLAASEYRRLVEFGPLNEELVLERKAMAVQLDTAVAQAGTRTNVQLATELYTAAFHREVVLSPRQWRDLLTPMLAEITVAEVIERVRAYRARPGREVAAVTGREDLGAGAEERIVTVLTEVAQAQLTRPVAQAVAAWAYPTDFDHHRAAGYWAMDPVNDLGITAQSRKNLRLQTRTSTAQPNQILISLRFETGVIPRAAGIGELIERGFLAGGLGKHPADEIGTIFADSSVSIGGISVGEDAVTLSASCTPPDYQRALELLAAYVADPGWRPEAEARVKQAWDTELAAAEQDVDAQTERTIQGIQVSKDPARRQATRAEAAAVTFTQAKAWLMPILSQAPLTVTTSGDCAAATGHPDILFTATDGRKPFPAPATEATIRSRLAPSPAPVPGEYRVEVHAQVAKALVRIAWPGDDMYDIHQTRRLSLLAQCLSERLRLKVREELGAAYSPGAWYVASEAYRGSGALNASLGVKPEQAGQVAKLTLDLADALATQGVDAALLDQVLTPVRKGLAARKQRNDWWAWVVLPRLATEPFRLAWAANLEADYAAVTPGEMSALAARYLVRAKAVTVIGIAKP